MSEPTCRDFARVIAALHNEGVEFDMGQSDYTYMDLSRWLCTVLLNKAPSLRPRTSVSGGEQPPTSPDTGAETAKSPAPERKGAHP